MPHGLKDEADKVARRSLALAGDLARVFGALAEAGMPCLTFKGPSESLQAYHNPSLRSFRDIDLIVGPKDVPAVVGILQSQGYRPIPPVHSPPHLAQILLLRRETSSAIDLHWRWTDLPGLFDWPFTEAYERRVAVNISGVPVYTLPDEERFLFLCLHGGLHFWEKLAWLCDLAWERSVTALDVDYLQRRARQLGVGHPLHLGMSLAHRLLGMPVPEGFAVEKFPSDLACLQARIIARLQAAPGQPRCGRVRRLADHLLLRDTWRYRLSELVYRARRSLASAR